MKKIYALVDCNNFYASCERVFQPSLARRPVVILSNNDGNVVARSDEAKKLGIPFAAPYFKWKSCIEKNGVAVFSSNYTLYGDMSRRVMELLAGFTPEIEIYSIDEAFLSVEGLAPDITAYARGIRSDIFQWTGIPVSVGIAPTKTLAKVANRIAKKNPDCGGVFNFCDVPSHDAALEKVGVDDVWGVGRQYGEMLKKNGIYTARELRDAPDVWVRKKMTIVGLRMVLELRGISCLSFDEVPSPKKGIVSSRSFGRPVEGLPELREALAGYVARGAEKLRFQGSLASFVSVFLMTNRFKHDEPQYSNGMTMKLPVATAYTPRLFRHADRILERIYRRGFRYKKIGVMFTGIIPAGNAQLDLFSCAHDTEKTERLMQTMDDLNRRMGRGTVRFASEGIARSWQMRRHYLSARYTTHWNEIPVVHAR